MHTLFGLEFKNNNQEKIPQISNKRYFSVGPFYSATTFFCLTKRNASPLFKIEVTSSIIVLKKSVALV